MLRPHSEGASPPYLMAGIPKRIWNAGCIDKPAVERLLHRNWARGSRIAAPRRRRQAFHFSEVESMVEPTTYHGQELADSGIASDRICRHE